MKTGKGNGREKGYMRSLALSKSWEFAFFQELLIHGDRPNRDYDRSICHYDRPNGA